MPVATSKADVIIIGSGQAGVPLATRLAGRGKTVVIAERGALGGTCVNYGCTPTKTMIASARAAHVARTAARLGIRTGDIHVDLPAIVERKDAIVRRWRDGVEKRLQRAGERVRIVRGHARFVAERTVDIEGARYSAPIVVINVGTRATKPSIAGIEGVPWLDNHRVMDLRDLPAHLIVLGGGYIGCEFGQMFRRFGSDVTIVHRGHHLLSHEDSDTAAALEEALRSEGIRLEVAVQAKSLEATSGGVAIRLADDRELRGSHLLVATGRTPNTDDLGCREGGIDLDAQGFVAVDDAYRTSAEGVFALGDVNGGPQFTHTSWDDHRILFERLISGHARPRSGRIVPFTVFTDPQFAGVGMTEEQARDEGVAYEVATMPFGRIARAIEVGEQAGILKILLDPPTEKILGARIVGAEAGELIHVFVSLMQAGATARAIVDAEYVHPTFAEGVQSLVMCLPRYALS
ncbi:MAG TPA: mercuric reductase [Polyangiaceae bacterium]